MTQRDEPDPRIVALEHERDVLKALLASEEMREQAQPCSVHVLKRKRQWLAMTRMQAHAKRLERQRHREEN